MSVHWHRRDLRPADNVGLAAAVDEAEDPVAPLFVLDDAVLAHAGPPRVAFLLDALASLRERYRERGSDLLVRRGDPRDVVPTVADEHDAELVTWNRDYSGLARERDAAVRRALDDVGVERSAHHDALCHSPGSITTNEGEHYSVFSYFHDKWAERDPGPTPAAPSADELLDADRFSAPNLDPLPTAADLDAPEPEADVQAGTRAAGRERLERFCDGPIYEYAEVRNVPAADGTSRVSPHLSFGTLGPREVRAAAEDAIASAPSEEACESAVEFRRQLAWREFYAQLLAANPSMVSQPLTSFERPVEWRDDPEAIQAWKDGETGFPIVDAGMRQLRAEAWMHNRVRMLVASFLTKDLLIDWREGLAWFRERLVDHDPASDAGGWQWAASTGADAQPYFRVFNPTTQGERYDPRAAYVQEYVPELRDVDPETIHSWPELSTAERDAAAPEYVEPIVDHAERREAAIAAFERARGSE